MNGLLGAPLPEFEEVFPGQKPLDQVGQPKQDAQGLLGAINKQSVEDPLYSEPLVSQQIATKDYSQIPKSEWQQQFEKEKTMPGGVRSVFDNDMLSVYMRDKYNAPLAQSPEEEEFLNRNNLTRDDVRNIIEQTPEGQDFLNMSFSEMGISPEFGGTGGTEGLAHSLNTFSPGSFEVNADVQNFFDSAINKGVKSGFGMLSKNVTNNPYAAAAIVGAGVGAVNAAKQGDWDSALTQAFTGAAKGAAGKLVKSLGVPASAAIGLVMGTYSGMKSGKDMGDAMADAAASSGLQLGATAIGTMIGGPIGGLLAGLAASAMLGSDMYSQGWIGDAFDSRTNEVFRDMYEGMDMDDKQRDYLDNMVKHMGSEDMATEKIETWADIISRGGGYAGTTSEGFGDRMSKAGGIGGV
jgi:hypothetical protein